MITLFLCVVSAKKNVGDIHSVKFKPSSFFFCPLEQFYLPSKGLAEDLTEGKIKQIWFCSLFLPSVCIHILSSRR